jgi:hypothetical protein
VCLVVIMVGVLADDYGFDSVQWRMSRPLSNIVNNGVVKREWETKMRGRGHRP